MEVRQPTVQNEAQISTTTGETGDNRYWLKEYPNLLPNVVFRIKKLDAVTRLDIVLGMSRKDLKKGEMALNYLNYWQWTKDGGTTWVDLLNPSGSSRLDELDTEPSLAFDLASIFMDKVIAPVFTESKISQQ